MQTIEFTHHFRQTTNSGHVNEEARPAYFTWEKEVLPLTLLIKWIVHVEPETIQPADTTEFSARANTFFVIVVELWPLVVGIERFERANSSSYNRNSGTKRVQIPILASVRRQVSHITPIKECQDSFLLSMTLLRKSDAL